MPHPVLVAQRRWSALAPVGVALVAAACANARPEPRQPQAAALFRDLEREVTVAAATGWGIDRLEVEGLLESALDSVCRVDALERRALRSWLGEEIQRQGGPVAQAWRARGKDLDEVEDLLVFTRVALLLARADEVAAADCPFWLEPEPAFAGRQISTGGWELTGGGGGKGIVVHRTGRTDLLFGGAGRLLVGRTFPSQRAVYLGLELGASASFPKDELGERSKLLVAADVVVPVVVRLTAVNSYLELEAGWLGHSTERDFFAFAHGVHVGVSLGARALRNRFVFPGAAFGVSLEQTFGAEQALTFKLGARIALDLDL